MIRGLKRWCCIRQWRNSDPPLLQAQQVRGNFSVHKMRTAIARSMCWAIFTRYCGQRTMANKGAKRNVPHLLQAQQAPICLWSISETLWCQKFQGIVTKSTVSSRVCWSLKVLWGSVSADFRQFQVGGEGKKRKKDTGMTGRVNESK